MMSRVLIILAVALFAVSWPHGAWSQDLDGVFSVVVFSVHDRSFALAGAEGSLHMSDVTDPDLPVPISVLTANTPGFARLGHVVDVEVTGGHALAADYVSGIVWIIDVVDPADPQLVHAISSQTPGFEGLGRPTDVEVISIDHILIASAGSNTLHVVDIGDPSSPYVASVLSASGLYALDDPRDVETFSMDDTTYAMVAAFADDAVLILDVTNPDAPKWVARIDQGRQGFVGLTGPENIATHKQFGKTYAFVAGGGSNTIQVMDVTDPKNPAAINCIWPGADQGRDDLRLISRGESSFLVTSTDMAVRLDLVSDSRTNFIDCIWRGHDRDAINHPADLEVLEVAGQTYLLVTGTDSIRIMDITRPWDVRLLTTVRDGSGMLLEDPYGITSYHAPDSIYAVVASFGEDSLQIIDVGNPASPSAAGHLTSTIRQYGPVWPADTSTFEIDGFVYVLASAAQSDNVQILDVTDPTSPDPLYMIGTKSGFDVEEPGAVEMYGTGDKMYGLIAGSDMIHSIDVTHPSSPSLAYTIEENGTASVLHVVYLHEYPYLLAAYGDTLHIFDLTSAVHVSSLRLPSTIHDIETFQASGTAYAALFAGDSLTYLHGAVSATARAAVANQTGGLEDLWRFGAAETIGVLNHALAERSAASGSIILLNIDDPTTPHRLDPRSSQETELDDVPDIAIFEVGQRTYLATIDHFDHEFKILDVTHPHTLGGVTSQVTDGKPGFDALAKPVRIQTVSVQNTTYGLVAGSDGRLQILDLTIPWQLRPADSLHTYTVVPQAEGTQDLEAFSILDRMYLLMARTSYIPYGQAVIILDITTPYLPDVVGGWSGR